MVLGFRKEWLADLETHLVDYELPRTKVFLEPLDRRGVIEVVQGPGEMVCNHQVGDSFEVHGEDLSFPAGQTFPLYPLAAILPLLPAKQRETEANDWMTTDTDVACPDPHCGAVFRITRIRERTFRHGEVTVVPLGRKR